MGLVIVFVLLLVNFGISWFNAWSCGRAWADSKAAGGWMRFLVWCGAVMSACGFTWVYLIIAALVVGAIGLLPPEYVQGAMELGYVVLIIPILGSGLGITVHSIGVAWRQRTLGSAGVAGWNTFAQVYNTYSAVKTLPGIFEHLGDLFHSSKSSDSKGKALLLMILLVIMALVGGILTTTAIIMVTARNYSQQVIEESAPRSSQRRPERAFR